jgi:uncharacterized membrane protein
LVLKALSKWGYSLQTATSASETGIIIVKIILNFYMKTTSLIFIKKSAEKLTNDWTYLIWSAEG